MTDDEIHDLVRDAYARVAREQSPCCGPESSRPCGQASAASDNPVPESELGLSCGNPLAFEHVGQGDVVVDLGSGAGKDVFLAARKVGPAGRAIGVDMTPDMLAAARKNAAKFSETTGLANVEFREGQIEDLPVEDASVDAVISNCVINLSPDKGKVFAEAFRVLKPGGRMIVSDIVLNRPLPQSARDNAGLYAACIAGALVREDYLRAVRDAGFANVEVLDDRTYPLSDICDDRITREVGADLSGAAASITILATR